MRLIVGNIYQGKEKYARLRYGEKVKIKRISMDTVKSAIDSGVEEVALCGELSAIDIVIAEEAYDGLTPISAEDRRLTEIYGRLLQSLASEAESVERVVCGLPVTLK